ncbi:hypothetical protein EJ08DRAFT_584006 [Tothia fuscella]|uniref:Nitrate reductase [NADPH] n=1 Tax=Tothia fuscella TaxID=1048955 RepID=A0A9P4NVY4_9PEZI|nr:hypothetical protein EJ08DRAFT_584006 [Tothia fuscella]
MYRASRKARFFAPQLRTLTSASQWISARRAHTSIEAPLLSQGSKTKAYSDRHGILGAVAIFATISLGLTLSNKRHVDAEQPVAVTSPEQRLIRLAEVRKHNGKAETYWVYRGDRVYDITDWVPNHPGGEVILRAVGGNIDPYWNIFSIHQKQDVYDILEQYFIGKIDPQDLADGRLPSEAIEDPFSTDPDRHESLIVRSSRPCNAETPTTALGTYITPNEVFYVRNHLWVPEIINPETHTLKVELMDGDEVEYTMDELRKKFNPLTITATLQCSGNRRAHMTRGSRQTNGLQWEMGAISNAEWTGVRLRDILADAGVHVDDIPEGVKHAQFMGAEAYGASIPIEKAIDRRGDTIIAYEMNGAPLPRDHGFPLRVVVPGHVAARSVKWLNKIILSDEESTSQWQRRDYKCFGPNEGKNPNWDAAASIQEMPVQSAITSLKHVGADKLNDSKLARVYGLEEESIVVEGYAFAGGGRRIVRVDISPDDGRSWQQAEILPQDEKGSKAWSWKQWRLAFPVRDVNQYFLVKAVDESYNTQPDSFDAHYNFRGNLTSGWHRVSATGSDLVVEVK